ncbi:hypothetical protein [Streptomyces eurythermus]
MTYEPPPPDMPPEEPPADAYGYGCDSSYTYGYEDEPPPDDPVAVTRYAESETCKKEDLRAETLHVNNREEMGRLQIADDFLQRDAQWHAIAELIKKLNGNRG